MAGHEENKSHSSSKHSNNDADRASVPTIPPMHDPSAPDLSFPFQSTNIDQGGLTNEYRDISSTGLVSASTALRPIPSNHSVTPAALRDPEKAKQLKDVKLVTFVPNDPEDPRNYSRWFKWCKWLFDFRILFR